jgi:hypothetical protein
MLHIIKDDKDLYAVREEPLVETEDLFGPSFFFILRNFDLNSHVLKPLHKEILRDRVANFVKTNVGFAELYAMADRSGSRKVNYQASASRLSEVQKNLLGLGAPSAKVMHAFAKAIGEDFYEYRYSLEHSSSFKDGAKDGQMRCVVIALTPAPIGVPTKNFRAHWIAETVAFCRGHKQTP